MKKFLAVILTLCMAVSLCALSGFSAFAEEAGSTPGSNVVILYTNDVHCGVNDNITVNGLVEIKKAIEATGKQVLLVDNGDAVQGDTIGTLSKGEYIIDIMNELGYAVAIPGNHEFDYTMDQFFNLTDRAKFPYISVNFTGPDGSCLFEPYAIITADGAKFAFVGVTTPRTLISSNPTNFMDENGEYIYGFMQDGTGEKLYAAVQNAVDAARAEGADYVFLMAHLGIEMDCAPYMSTDVITHTTGIDAVLDGHSHSVIEKEYVKNAEGKNVILTSTGTKLANVGCLTIGKDGTLSTTLINGGGINELLDNINAQFEELFNTVIAHTDYELCHDDPATGERMIRSAESNLGDFCADAYRYASGADIAFVNGGGIRAGIPAGDITYGQLISVYPYGNEMCMVEATGQEILDALELTATGILPKNGNLQHVSGMSYTVDLSIEPSVVLDENGMFVRVDGERCVKDVMVGGEPIDPEGIYTLASHDFMLRNMGGGCNMFADNNFLLDRTMTDNQVLINYLLNGLGGNVSEEYADPYGQGRITIIGG